MGHATTDSGDHTGLPAPQERKEKRRGGQHDDAASDPRLSPPSGTAQNKLDVEERSKHSRSENALESSQDKNPIPSGSVKKS